jgi:hypothetical protein
MEIQGVLKKILKTESGTSKSGKDWQKQTIIVETEGQYPKSIAIVVPEKLMPRLQDYQLGHVITCSINIESREHQGKWYTSINAWKI